MKIYFQDGELVERDAFDRTDIRELDAAYGPFFCRMNLKFILKYSPDDIVYTNSLVALNNDYVWDDKNGAPELYLKVYNSKADEYIWTRIDKLTDKEIKKAHNLMKMYLAGSFKTIIDD